MRIHYYMHYFPGVSSVGSRQPYTFARFLAERGHEVTVVSSNLNLDTEQKETPEDTQTPAGGRLRILRLASLRGGRGANLARLTAYVAFMGVAGLRGATLSRPDVIVGSVQPLFTGLAALAAAKLRRAPFVLEIRDLWPDALVVKGALSGWQAKPLFWLANLLYRKAQRIVSLTPGIRAELLKKGVPGSKVDVFPNGLDIALFAGSEEKSDEIRRSYGWNDQRVAIYTGSFTKVTAVDVFVRAAARLRDISGLRFELFGNGPTRSEVEALADELHATNVTFHNPVPKREVPALLAAADLGLMSLFATPLAHIYFENKFMDYMGAAKPIFGAMAGQQADIISDQKLGRVVGPGDDQGLAQLIRQAFENRRGLEEMGRRGKQFVEERLLLPDILDRYAQVVEAAARGDISSLPAWIPV
jgi:glycosyltransferase involved in cell wall biosynthesis